MKVLWFTDSPSLASDFLNHKRNITGWIESLQKEIEKIEGLDLFVAFPFGNHKENRFMIGNTKYYSFPYPHDKKNLSGFLSRWKHDTESESVISHYLKVVEEFEPDVIQIFGTESPFGLIIPHIKVPVVIHIQGNLTICSKKWFSGISNFDILRFSSLKAILKAYGLWHLHYNFRKRAARERRIMNSCHYFIGRTDWDRRISKVLSPGSTYYHCDELLREEFYNAKRWQIPSQKKIKLVSTVSPMVYKGLETVLETAEILRNNRLAHFEWVIVGIRGTEEIIGIIEKTIKLKFDDQNIFFRGSLNSNKLLEEFYDALLYVHPSHIENSPNSVCEAMLVGMPVIATYSGGTPSIVTNGIDGLLVQDGDPYVMAGAILELVSDTNLLKKIANNAYNSAIHRHDRQSVKNRMADIYQKIIEVNITMH